MAEHASLTGSNLHEPKGADTAASGAVYIADGAGSGTWTNLKNANRLAVTAVITDVSTAGDIYVCAPLAGKIIKAYAVLGAAITVADSIVKLKIGGVDVTNGSMTITQSGSAAGSTFSATPTAANTVTAGQAIQINTDGGSTTTASLTITLLLDVS